MDAFNLFAKLTLDSSEYESGLAKAKGLASTVGSGLKTAMDVGLKAVAGATAAVGAFGVSSVKTGMDFDKSMSQVAATMGKSMDEMANEVGTATVSVNGQLQEFSGNLRDYAQFMGANTAFSASQAADALNYMALAGYDAQTSMSMLPNVLNLAAAGSMELATASDMITDTQSAFGISLERTTQMVDEMAKASSTGNTSVQQLGEAFLQVGGLAQELNGGIVTLADGTTQSVDGIQELEIALTAMANAGVKGSEAGNHMRNMILKLSSPTKDGVEALDAMGISVFNAEGNMRSLADIMTDLNGAFENMTQEQKIQTIADLFNTRDLASAEALLGAVEQDWNKIGESILNAEGAAQKMADTQLDNLAGDITLFKSALEGVQIAISDKLTPAFRDFIQGATSGLSEMTGAIKNGDWDGVVDVFSRFLSNVLDRIISGLPMMVDAGMRILGSVGQGILDNLPTILDAASQILTMLVEGIIGALPSLLDGAVQIIGALGQFIIENLPLLVNAAIEAVVQLANMLAENADNVVEGVIALVEAIAKCLTENFPIVVEAVLKLIVAISKALITHIPDIINVVVQYLSDCVQAIVTAMPDFINAVVEILTSIGSELASWLGQFLSDVGQFLSNLLTDTNKGMSDTFNKIVEWLVQIPPQMAYYAGYAVGEFIKFVSELPGKAQEIFNNVIENVIAFATDFVNKAVEMAKNFFDSIVNGIKDLPANMEQLGKDLLKAVEDLPSKFLDIGSNIVSGLWNGIKGGWDWLTTEVSNLANSLFEGVKDSLDIESPSKKFKWIGQMVDEGFALGITNNGDMVTDAINKMLNIPNIDNFDIASTNGAYNNAGNANKGYTQIINITSPTALSPYEVARQTRNATRDMVLSMRV